MIFFLDLLFHSKESGSFFVSKNMAFFTPQQSVQDTSFTQNFCLYGSQILSKSCHADVEIIKFNLSLRFFFLEYAEELCIGFFKKENNDLIASCSRDQENCNISYFYKQPSKTF